MLAPNRIEHQTAAGVRRYVQFTVGGLRYDATVLLSGERRVVSLHRVDDSRTPIKYTSISVANPRFARVAGVLWQLLAA